MLSTEPDNSDNKSQFFLIPILITELSDIYVNVVLEPLLRFPSERLLRDFLKATSWTYTPSRVGVPHHSSEEGNRASFQNVPFFRTQTKDKVKKAVTLSLFLCVIHIKHMK